jgi:glycosyltransferase involved in cell wall biosynthesis
MRQLNPIPQLVIIGSGPLGSALAKQADELGVSGTVRFTGNVAHSELPQWYRAADLTVIPSLLEWFGSVAVESLACGTPIIGTEAGGLVDIVAEFECGLLVAPGDSAALAGAIVETLGQWPLPTPNIARGRAAFDWSVKIAHMMRLWESMEVDTRNAQADGRELERRQG